MIAREDLHSRTTDSEAERASAPDSGHSDAEQMFASARSELTNLFGSLRRVAFLEWQSFRLRALDASFRGALFVCFLGFGLAASISAALLLVQGVKSGLHAWSGAAWAGDLGGGAIVLAIVILTGFGLRAAMRRDLVHETERQLARKLPRKGAA